MSFLLAESLFVVYVSKIGSLLQRIDILLLLLVYPSSYLGWRYGANSNPGSRHQSN